MEASFKSALKFKYIVEKSRPAIHSAMFCAYQILQGWPAWAISNILLQL